MNDERKSVDAFEEAADNTAASEDSLLKISRLAEKQVALEHQLETLEQEQKKIKRELMQVAQVDLPEAMDEVGMGTFTLSNGFGVEVADGVDARITEKNRPGAHAWLSENGHGDLITKEVKAQPDREDQETYEKVVTALSEYGVPFDVKEAVHHSRLKAFVKEQLRKGVAIPEDLFGIFNYRKTKINRPKK